MSHPGIAKPTIKSCVAGVMVLAGKWPAKKARKARARETTPREQPERELRNTVIKELRRHGVKVMRVENSITGINNTGLPDLWVVNVNKNIAGWIELKSLRGVLTGNQPQFREDCLLCGVKHWVVRSVSEAMEAIG